VLETLIERFRQSDRLALSRLLSWIAQGERVDEIFERLLPISNRSRTVAITGPGGVGKSTLIGKLIEWLRSSQQTVAVLACDPQSPLSGGALLGDRFRMPSRPEDDGVFIRSLATAGGQGALARNIRSMIRLLEAFGFQMILIETVGAGQGDTAVRAVADQVVLLLQPEIGDDLQWEKAGLLEVADIIVIHKADLPGAQQAEAQVRAAIDLAPGRPVSVLRVSAKTGEGIEPLGKALLAAPLRPFDELAPDRELLRLAQERLAARFAAAQAGQDAQLHQLLADWRQGSLGREKALAALWCLLDNRCNG
jgi:LAO/AO transport system ATPase